MRHNLQKNMKRIKTNADLRYKLDMTWGAQAHANLFTWKTAFRERQKQQNASERSVRDDGYVQSCVIVLSRFFRLVLLQTKSVSPVFSRTFFTTSFSSFAFFQTIHTIFDSFSSFLAMQLLASNFPDFLQLLYELFTLKSE